MDGDIADDSQLVPLKKEHDCLLMVDEAHAIGLYEHGQGSSYNNRKYIDLTVATFGKALGSYGAFVGCSNDMRSYLINKASSFIYSTALPLPVIQFNIACLALLPTLQSVRKQLQLNTKFFREQLADMSLDVLGMSNIVPICFDSLEKTLSCSNRLKKEGFLALPIRPPTVDAKRTRVRFSLCATHTLDQLKSVCNAIRT